jgi:hypothetical protein
MNIWPPLVYVGFSILGLGYAIAKDGQPRPPYSMWAQLFAIALAWPILWWGGFFAPLLVR